MDRIEGRTRNTVDHRCDTNCWSDSSRAGFSGLGLTLDTFRHVLSLGVYSSVGWSYAA